MNQLQRKSSAGGRLTFVWMSTIACLGLLGLSEQVFTQANQNRSRMWAPPIAGAAPGEGADAAAASPLTRPTSFKRARACWSAFDTTWSYRSQMHLT